jgi:hypothetical protein
MTQPYRPQQYRTFRQRLPRKLDWLVHDLHWLALNAYHRIFRPRFEFEGREILYDISRKGVIQERDIEIPLAKEALLQLPHPVEIGCVLTHYGAGGHKVVDLYEKCGACENIDAAKYAFGETEAQSVLSISTLEHIGWDPPEPVDPAKSAEVLRRILDSGQPYFVSFPLGYNPYLTDFLAGALFPPDQVASNVAPRVAHFAIFQRQSLDRWKQVSLAPADFSRLDELNRRPTRYVAFLWKGVDFRAGRWKRR